MAIPVKVINFLDKNKAKYDILEHKIVYTAYDKAQTLKVDERAVGKTIVVKIDEKKRIYALVLIPANKNLDKQKFKKAAKSKKVDFAKELWMKKNLKGMKIGSVSPFGSLFKLQVFAEKALLKNKKIIVSSGDYVHSISLTPTVFKKINPDLVLGNFSATKK